MSHTSPAAVISAAAASTIAPSGRPELVSQIAGGLPIAPLTIHAHIGFTQVGLALTVLLVLINRRGGLLRRREITRWGRPLSAFGHVNPGGGS